MKIIKKMIYYDHLRWFYLKKVMVIIGIFELKIHYLSARMHVVGFSEIISSCEMTAESTATTSHFLAQTRMSDIFTLFPHDLNHFRT